MLGEICLSLQLIITGTKMRNITLFATPKYFKPPFTMIQYNAIRSWLSLDPTPEVILCGNDEGVAGAAVELGVTHIPDIELSAKGTPLVNSIFSRAQKVAKNSILAYVNSDIVLMGDFLDTLDIVSSVFHHQFMIIGQRWDLWVDDYIDFSNVLWEHELRKKVEKIGKLHPQCGIDYFVFEKGFGMDMPPFNLGRTCWDNWIVSHALRIGLDVVDATEKVFAVHQNHDYSHTGGEKKARKGDEAIINRRLLRKNIAFIQEAKWRFLNNKLVKK